MAAGAAGASTIDSGTAPAMSLGDRVAVAAATSRATASQPGPDHADLLRGARPVSRSTVRSTPAPSSTPSGKAAAKSTKPTPRRTAAPSRLAAKRAAKPAAKAQPVLSPWTCPIAGCGGRFTSPFGGRWGTQHLGDDFATPVGTPLHALHDATVVAVGPYGGMGNRVELDLGDGVHAVYAHMSYIAVTVGERLSMGDVVGRSGDTGHSTGPHLHLEIHLNGTPVDPAPWLKAHHIF
ncbi:peptidoglycan DD-metalloendopeptidase family protein [Allobranchiibius huperziae]|uniref:Murein DD-endopeptidase MepM/ murein hydrolase activator NlpD n=1 Tax=Allobranchiibius huperziae TaxID=1874116 RepID=A0A853DHY1_9MICO|nr:murein DD-endopeptidase MepM/ murein hydrolase activator NlpD [Allobranchiibius huperziae]